MRSLQKIFQFSIAFTGWLAVIVQFCLMMQNRVNSVPETIIRFFSFFTILTNILVASAFTILTMSKPTPSYKFFSRTNVITAITSYIFIVGLVYNTVLRSVWDPQGLQLYVDEALHVATPVLCLLYWLLYVPGRKLKWEDAIPWLWYPLIYLVYILVRGSISKFYPYFFINVDELGYSKVIVNAVYVTTAFLVISLLMIWTGRSLKRN